MSNSFLSTCLSADQIELYARRALAADSLLIAESHLRDCHDCRQRLMALLKVDAAFVASSLQDELSVQELSDSCLSYEQKESYVDGTLPLALKAETVAHLNNCQFCEASVADLMAMKDLLAETNETAVKHSHGWWQKLKQWQPRFFPLPVWQPAMAVAVVLLVFGVVWMNRQSSEVELTVQNKPDNQQIISTDKPAEPVTVIQINDATGIVSVNATGQVEGLGALNDEQHGALKDALLAQRLEVPKPFAGESFDGAVLLGKDDEKPIGKISPVAVVVESRSPIFRWPSVKDATGYVVTIHDENFVKVAESRVLTTTEWKPDNPLKYGANYSWQVRVNREAGSMVLPVQTESLAEFRVIGRKQAEELARGKREFGQSHLMLGILYAQAGMRNEARREFQQLLTLNREASPQTQQAIRKLLKQVER